MANHTINPAQPSTGLSDLTAGSWVLNATKSSVEINHKSMWGLATIRAAFTEFSGEGEIGPDGSAHGTLTIEAASILSKQAKLDTHLRSADFFDVERYPTFTFTATGVVADGAGTAKVTGRLTVLGTTRPLTFTARVASVGGFGAGSAGQKIEFDLVESGQHLWVNVDHGASQAGVFMLARGPVGPGASS
ncbi:YceI family protein [Nonomuraea sediminis]|uniref:YceI family protein n=1 Tax=Nonomuraea sediminis TaxID=2835864 RepID=UPI001BDD6423|nr:YceI family protein [Nonomuraea sediminis]